MKLLTGHTLIGHSLKGDIKLLNFEHPKHLIRDVSKYRKYRNKKGGKMSLRVLSDTFLQKVIQEGSHSSVEDSQAAMALYREVEKDWENQIKQKKRTQQRTIGEMFNSFKSEITKGAEENGKQVPAKIHKPTDNS